MRRAEQPVGRALATLVLLCAAASPAFGTIYTVNEAADLAAGASCADGSPTCTLREAILQANMDAAQDVVLVPAGHYVLGIPGTAEDAAATGDLDILEDLVLIGAGAAVTTIDANSLDRVFDIRSGASVEIWYATITGGEAPAVDTGTPTRNGGGIRVYHAGLVLNQSRLVANRAESGGGLVGRGSSSVSILDSYVGGNALFEGIGTTVGAGVKMNYFDGELTISRSTISENTCPDSVSISCPGGVLVESCDALDAVEISNSTIAGNHDAGVRAYGCDVSVSHSTIVGNGYGISFGSFSGLHELAVRSSIMADNSTHDCQLTGGVLDLQGGLNLDTDGTCDLATAQGDLRLTDPVLHPFGFYADLTPSFHPMPGSPVIDVPGSCQETRDQDNFQRPDGDETAMAHCDIGSIEVLPCDNDKPVRLLGPDPIGSGTWEACHILAANGTSISDGSTVTLAARELVRFDEGFVAGSGVTLTVEMRRDADWTP